MKLAPKPTLHWQFSNQSGRAAASCCSCCICTSIKYKVFNLLLAAVSQQDWTKEEIKEVYDMPMLELLYRASSVHRMFFDPTEVQQCTLLSIKTGGCTEDCGYCSQSVRHKTFVKPTPQMKARLFTYLCNGFLSAFLLTRCNEMMTFLELTPRPGLFFFS